jgi:hypothetical protein
MNIPRFAGRFDCGILEYERPRNALTELPPEARDTYRFNKSQIIFDTDEFITPMHWPYKSRVWTWNKSVIHPLRDETRWGLCSHSSFPVKINTKLRFFNCQNPPTSSGILRVLVF